MNSGIMQVILLSELPLAKCLLRTTGKPTAETSREQIEALGVQRRQRGLFV
jgi:hypothetical protein